MKNLLADKNYFINQIVPRCARPTDAPLHEASCELSACMCVQSCKNWQRYLVEMSPYQMITTSPALVITLSGLISKR